jgi:hypothetical protein
MFHPTLGRWLQDDPISFGGGDANLYRTEADSPLSGLDPIGLADPITIRIDSDYYDPTVRFEMMWGRGGLSSYRNEIFRLNTYVAATATGDFLYDLLIRPVYRTGQFVVDVPQAAYDSEYQPNNPMFRAYLNHEVGLERAWPGITLDAVACIPVAKGASLTAREATALGLDRLRNRALSRAEFRFDPALETPGSTDPLTGKIRISPSLTGDELYNTIAHEQSHSAGIPTTGPLSHTRAVWNRDLYAKYDLYEYLEEAKAEAIGTGDLMRGLKYPFKVNPELSRTRMGFQGFLYVGGVGTSSYGAYNLSDFLLEKYLPEVP